MHAQITNELKSKICNERIKSVRWNSPFWDRRIVVSAEMIKKKETT